MSKQVENSRLAIKLEIRRRILRHVAGPLAVLDCCTAKGLLWANLRREFEVGSYLPVDLKPQLPGTLRMDSRDAVRALDLAAFNVIDVDTFGEPWEHWGVIVEKLAQPTAVFLTHGHVTQGQGGGVSLVARRMMGIPETWAVPQHPALQRLAADYCLAVSRDRLDIHAAVRFTSPRVDYYGLFLAPNKKAE